MIKEYSKVKLKSGEVGYIVEIYNNGEAYEVELPEFELRTVKPDDIAELLEKQTEENA
ncbi:MAG: DUF4926 domain-containing protein [Acidaminococcaceae bacterium]|nr:DUF4926 domain-containing protein [Acidaminococcaceae bacterium]